MSNETKSAVENLSKLNHVVLVCTADKKHCILLSAVSIGRATHKSGMNTARKGVGNLPSPGRIKLSL